MTLSALTYCHTTLAFVRMDGTVTTVIMKPTPVPKGTTIVIQILLYANILEHIAFGCPSCRNIGLTKNQMICYHGILPETMFLYVVLDAQRFVNTFYDCFYVSHVRSIIWDCLQNDLRLPTNL